MTIKVLRWSCLISHTANQALLLPLTNHCSTSVLSVCATLTLVLVIFMHLPASHSKVSNEHADVAAFRTMSRSKCKVHIFPLHSFMSSAEKGIQVTERYRNRKPHESACSPSHEEDVTIRHTVKSFRKWNNPNQLCGKRHSSAS